MRPQIYLRSARGISRRLLIPRGQQSFAPTEPLSITLLNDATIVGSKRVSSRRQRRYFDFQNESDTAMRINFGFPASANVGANIAAGAFRAWNVADDIGVVIDDIYVFCTVAGKIFSYSEAGS